MNKQIHEQNLNANITTARLINEGKTGFDIEIALAVNDLTSRVCQERSITRKAAKKLITGLIEVAQ